MSDFSIAAAQITCVAGNIDVNTQRHSIRGPLRLPQSTA